MLIRAALLLAFTATLTACGEPEPEPERVCCAIVPRAKCEGALGGLGVSRQEQGALFGPDAVCPSSVMTVERLRELDGTWPQECREAGMMSPLLGLDSVACHKNDVSLDDLGPPAGVDVQAWAACGAGLKSRGLKDNELWVVLHEPEGICPNVGVSEPRIREIIANDWNAASCTHATKEAMLKALDTGGCGGDAG